MAKPETKEEYRAKGMHYAAQGQKRYPQCDALEALCRHAEDRTDILAPNTVRPYKLQYCAAAIVIGRTTGLDRQVIIQAMWRLVAALDRLAGTPPEPRTSAKKVKDPEAWMVKEVFGHLKIMAVRRKRIRSAAVALYCLLVPKLGTRPVELTQAWVKGNTLFVPSAKQPEGQNSVRRIDITTFDPSHREALLALICIVAQDVKEGGYRAWLGRLAEILARTCETVTKKTGRDIPRLAPTSFRHTAISTWHKAGYTAQEIAELVGHLNIRSQNAYKRSSSAWSITGPLARPAGKQEKKIDLGHNQLQIPPRLAVKGAETDAVHQDYPTPPRPNGP